MRLYLLRHGIAERRFSGLPRGDADRRLTPEGRRKMKRIAETLAARGVTFDRILSSPYRRAKQSARIVAETLEFKRDIIITTHLEPGGSLDELVRELAESHAKRRHILLVGHEPSMSTLISVLISGQPGVKIAMKKGGLCRLSVDGLRYGRCATLEWLLPPSQMLSDR